MNVFGHLISALELQFSKRCILSLSENVSCALTGVVQIYSGRLFPRDGPIDKKVCRARVTVWQRGTRRSPWAAIHSDH